jgi:hypothetical protein
MPVHTPLDAITDSLAVVSEKKVPYNVLYLENGDGTQTECEGSLVRFYDSRFRFTPHGQFVSCYYVSTLLESPRVPPRGLCLQGGVREWDIDAVTMAGILDWLAAKPYASFALKRSQTQTQGVPACRKLILSAPVQERACEAGIDLNTIANWPHDARTRSEQIT